MGNTPKFTAVRPIVHFAGLPRVSFAWPLIEGEMNTYYGFGTKDTDTILILIYQAGRGMWKEVNLEKGKEIIEETLDPGFRYSFKFASVQGDLKSDFFEDDKKYLVQQRNLKNINSLDGQLQVFDTLRTKRVTIMFVGEKKVGKSTLINSLQMIINNNKVISNMTDGASGQTTSKIRKFNPNNTDIQLVDIPGICDNLMLDVLAPIFEGKFYNFDVDSFLITEQTENGLQVRRNEHHQPSTDEGACNIIVNVVSAVSVDPRIKSVYKKIKTYATRKNILYVLVVTKFDQCMTSVKNLAYDDIMNNTEAALSIKKKYEDQSGFDYVYCMINPNKDIHQDPAKGYAIALNFLNEIIQIMPAN
jgi:energy-coupling factor transporter ATP-binding protein EcfA2